MSADVIDSNIANMINNGISENNYSENAKNANVRPIFKKGYKTK